MIKRLFSLAISIILLLAASGCASILEGETSVIVPYIDNNAAKTDSGDETITVSTYDEFKSSVKQMVKDYSDYAAFRITEFDREDLENSLNQACQEIALEDPLGSYAVYYISCDVTPIVTYYDVKVSIVFKRTQEEIQNIVSVYSERYLQYSLLSSIQAFEEHCTFHTTIDTITSEFITSAVEKQYYESPLTIIVLPTVDISTYPSGEGDRITDVSFSYGYSSSVLSSMASRLDSAASEIAEHVEGYDDHSLLLGLCEKLASTVEFIPQGGTPLNDTAYSALVQKEASSAGIAMAYKALCDKMGLTCKVVKGSHLGEEHFWNIVTLSGFSYHVDITEYLSGNVFLKGDDFMRGDYWWDTGTVPVCPTDYDYISSGDAGATVGQEDTVTLP